MGEQMLTWPIVTMDNNMNNTTQADKYHNFSLIQNLPSPTMDVLLQPVLDFLVFSVGTKCHLRGNSCLMA